MSGREKGHVSIIGLGPGAEGAVTPDAQAALGAAQDIIGYGPYVARVQLRPDQERHASDNRVEIERARHALDLAAGGRRVAVVSSGDPGVFAMAAAIFEALEADPARWEGVAITVIPGITAMLAAAARLGAPLGHDFCAINLSDNLKPWELVEKRLRHAARGDFAMAFYNPSSRSRPWQFARTLEILREECGPDTVIVFARNVTRDDERFAITTLAEARPEQADMRTVVIVGSSLTRLIERGADRPIVYTPRWAGMPPEGAA